MKKEKQLIRILKINSIEKSTLRISVLFSNGEDGVLDFNKILKEDWKVTKSDPEYKLLIPDEFAKVKVVNHTLSWDNIDLFIIGANGGKIKVPFEVGADTLFDLIDDDNDDQVNEEFAAKWRKKFEELRQKKEKLM